MKEQYLLNSPLKRWVWITFASGLKRDLTEGPIFLIYTTWFLVHFQRPKRIQIGLNVKNDVYYF